MSPGWTDRPPFTAIGLVWKGRPVPQGRGPAADGDGVALRVVTANALKLNRRPEQWAAAALALAPDVLCVQELTPAIESALVAAGLHERFPGGCAEAEAGSGGTGIWTSRPVASTELGMAGYVLAAVRLELGVTVASIHAVAPSSKPKVPLWLDSFRAIGDLAARTPGPLVVAGDYNATLAHGPLRRLLAEGRLRDAHVDAGRWRRARTYPTRLPLALLDRVLVTEQIAVRAVTEHRLPGSDHLAVAADLRVVVPAAPIDRADDARNGHPQPDR